MSKNWRNGSDAKWKHIRRQVMENNRLYQNGECQLGFLGICTGVATEAHHLLGRAVTGDDPRWIVAVCKSCNLHEGDPTKKPDPKANGNTFW